MPRSRSKRSSYRPPPTRKPPKAPPWVPYLGIGLVVAGTLVVILGYLVALFGGPLSLLIGFGLMGAGLIVLSRLR